MAKQNKTQTKTVEELEDEKLANELNQEKTAEETEAPEEESKELAPEEEEAKTEEIKPKKKKKDDEDIVEERIYTIPLQRALVRPPKKRTPRAMQLLKIFITKHMKLNVRISEEDEDEETPQLIISKEVNEKLWSKGIEKPPRRIRVRAAKDKDGNVTIYLAENKQ
jgi:large subunit ribosomal protein L31e